MAYAARIKPEENVEYTFRFGNGKIQTLRYSGTSNSYGRLIFQNVKLGTLTTMLPERFAYIHRFYLLSKKEVASVDPNTLLANEERKRQIKKHIDALFRKKKTVSERLLIDLKKETGLTVEIIIEDLSLALQQVGKNDALVDNACKEYNFFLRYLQRYR